MSKIDKTFLRDVGGTIGKIDLTDASNLSNKVLKERETRTRLLATAREKGIEHDMVRLFDKIDGLMRNCTNDKERADIAQLGVVETYRLLGGGGELYVNGQLVCKDK